jgi:hypothetical protein
MFTPDLLTQLLDRHPVDTGFGVLNRSGSKEGPWIHPATCFKSMAFLSERERPETVKRTFPVSRLLASSTTVDMMCSAFPILCRPAAELGQL